MNVNIKNKPIRACGNCTHKRLRRLCQLPRALMGLSAHNPTTQDSYSLYLAACLTYSQVLNRGSVLTNKLMSKGSLQSRLQAALRKFFGRYNNLVCQYTLHLGHIYVSYQSLSQSWYTDLNYGSYCLLELELRLMTGVTGLTPPRIPPLMFPWVRVSHVFNVDSSIYLIWTLILTGVFR
jgi:hypothetical protein